MSEIDEIKQMLARCSEDQRREVLEHLRQEFPIHPLEAKLTARAEIILEAIDRASDLTLRGIRGIIAEAAFKLNVISALVGWRNEQLEGDSSYDFLLRDSVGPVRVQVKMQRLKGHRPMAASEGYRRLPPDAYVVETQRTRGGRNLRTQEDTRPYRFGEFDILAVSMHPSTQDWSSFMYTVCNWLVPREENPKFILKFQPVAKSPNDVWTDDFEAYVRWFRSRQKKRIWRLPRTEARAPRRGST